MARVALPESRIRARRRRRRVLLAALSIFLLCAVAGGAVYLAQARFLRIARIDVTGAQTLATSTVAALAQEELNGSYFYLFPKDNIFLYSKSAIEQSITAALPVVKEANVGAEDFTSIHITIIERVPKALWCGEEAPASTTVSGQATSTPCELLDEDGVAYAPTLDAAGADYKEYFGTLSTSTPPQFATPAEFRSLTALVDTIAESQQSTPVESIFVDSNNDVHLQFTDGFMLLFPLDADGGDVYQRYQLALTSDPFTTHPISDFEYLDLRFGDKLYYKLK